MEVRGDSSKLKHMTQWKSKLDLEYDHKDWGANWQNLRKCTKSLTIREPAFKLFTPQWLGRIFRQSSSSYFRGCASPGSLLHVFWECEKLQPTWRETLHLIDKMALTHTHYFLKNSLIPLSP